MTNCQSKINSCQLVRRSLILYKQKSSKVNWLPLLLKWLFAVTFLLFYSTLHHWIPNCISLFRYMRWTTQSNPNPRKCDPGTYVWTLAVPRWAQDNSKVTQGLKIKWKWHPYTMFFVFVTWFSVHFAKHHEAHLRSHHITALAASHLHEWPTYTRATNARETHTIQRGVGGMRRKPGNFCM